MASTAKLERQLNLMAALLETRRPLTAAELKRRVPGYPDDRSAFRRAFERDKDELRGMGIPVVLEAIEGSTPPQEGYRIPRDQYYLREPGLDADELAALHVAASAVRVEGVEGGDALLKLGGLPEEEDRGSGPTHALASVPTAAEVVALFGAVSERRSVTFSYLGARRTLDPYRLDFQRGRWYVTGFDHQRREERSFRIDRVEGKIETGRAASFARPATHVPGARLHPWQLGAGEPVIARVLVDADQAPMALQYVGPDSHVETRRGGAVVLELAVRNPDGFRSFVLGFLEHAEVLDPPALVEDIVGWLEAVATTGAEEGLP